MTETVDPSSSQGNYNTLKEDPESLLRLINRYVKVYLLKNISFSGFVHAIDPVTHSIILSIPQEDSFQTTLIPGHAIVTILEEPNRIQGPLQEITLGNKVEECSRKEKLIAWFKKNLLPVSNEEENIVVGGAKVLPPYSIMDIYSENPIVAVNIRKIMSLMPENFESK